MSGEFGFEIDFIPVGDGERSGDAIAIRYGVPGAYRVMIVDGGNKEAGEKLVAHVRTHYGTSHVDHLVNTHPDGDHASGLEIVLEQLSVGEVWVHKPWLYPHHILPWCVDGRITPNSLRDRLRDALWHAHRIDELAQAKGIPCYEPFQGSKIGEHFWVASPAKDWYLDILAHFDKTPETKKATPRGIIASTLSELANQVRQWVEEKWDIETLSNNAETSYDNESSVVLWGNFDGRGILLTGDAGVQALSRAATYLEPHIDLIGTLDFIQIPHHGSRHNVTPEVLDRLVGPIRPVPPEKHRFVAFASAGAKSTTHPRRVVTNAFARRGARVCVAKGKGIRHHVKMPARKGWVPAVVEPFHTSVES
jgi:beta-lactamase superfamily II metal-dependent hydrolase